MVHRGLGLLRGDLLSAAGHGVVSYHHGDPRTYRGVPAGFWKYVHDEPMAGMTVQLSSENPDKRTALVYDEIHISECASWGDLRDEPYGNLTEVFASAVGDT